MPTSGHITRNAATYIMRQISSDNTVSGGQHQWVRICDAFNSGADILLLDEPTNNLDASARAKLFNMMRAFHGGIIVVSHDRELLNQLDCLYELRNGKLTRFGGNYDFYVAMRDASRRAIASEYADTVKEIRRLTHSAKIATQTSQHHMAKQSRDRANSVRSRLEANMLRGKSSETAGRKLQIINKKMRVQIERNRELSDALRDDTIKIPMPLRPMLKNDVVSVRDLYFSYSGGDELFGGLSLHIRGAARVHIAGDNGAGKTTLLRLIMGDLRPCRGTILRIGRAVYLTQNLSLLCPDKSIIDNIIDFTNLDTNSAHAIAANFGFRGVSSRRLVSALSGGELLKATLAAVLGSENQPDLLILDEPTNNLDIKSMTILQDALNQYMGALLVVSHDIMFVQNLRDMETVVIN